MIVEPNVIRFPLNVLIVDVNIPTIFRFVIYIICNKLRIGILPYITTINLCIYSIAEAIQRNLYLTKTWNKSQRYRISRITELNLMVECYKFPKTQNKKFLFPIFCEEISFRHLTSKLT